MSEKGNPLRKLLVTFLILGLYLGLAKPPTPALASCVTDPDPHRCHTDVQFNQNMHWEDYMLELRHPLFQPMTWSQYQFTAGCCWQSVQPNAMGAGENTVVYLDGLLGGQSVTYNQFQAGLLSTKDGVSWFVFYRGGVYCAEGSIFLWNLSGKPIGCEGAINDLNLGNGYNNVTMTLENHGIDWTFGVQDPITHINHLVASLGSDTLELWFPQVVVETAWDNAQYTSDPWFETWMEVSGEAYRNDDSEPWQPWAASTPSDPTWTLNQFQMVASYLGVQQDNGCPSQRRFVSPLNGDPRDWIVITLHLIETDWLPFSFCRQSPAFSPIRQLAPIYSPLLQPRKTTR